MLGLLGLGLGVALGAGPEEPSSWLRWQAPSTCPDAAHVQAAVEARLGRAPAEGEIEVRATVVDQGSEGLALELETTPPGGPTDVRRLDAHECRALADATALLVALSVDPVAVAAVSAARAEAQVDAQADAREADAREGGGEADAVVDPVAPSLEPPLGVEATTDTRSPLPDPNAPVGSDAAPPQRSARPSDLLVHAMGGPEVGALPGVAGGASASVGLGWSRLRVEVGALWIGLRSRQQALATVRVQLAGAVVRACARVGARRIEVPLCGGVDLGAVIGEGERGTGARTAVGPWIAPHVTAGLHGWVLARLAVVGRVEVAVPALSTAFVAVDPGAEVEIFRTGPVSARFWLGLETKFRIGRDGSTGSRRMVRGRP